MKTCNTPKDTLRRCGLAALFLVPLQTSAHQYQGEFCWDTQESSATEVTGSIRVDVWHDQGSFSLRGTLADSSLNPDDDGNGDGGGALLPDEPPNGTVDAATLVVTGGADILPAEAAGESIVAVSLRGSSEEIFVQVNLALDPDTLDGGASAVVFLTQPNLSTRAWAGEVSLAQCP